MNEAMRQNWRENRSFASFLCLIYADLDRRGCNRHSIGRLRRVNGRVMESAAE
ncbi:hypothetical protein ACFQPF_14210 [Fictibacillus iocasae]|uniref:Uncharacterized protein n=1 Tax=Fictibacillus iocasae TaxID=2715437 RepID=A0ABW2NTW9_9BACL